MKKEYDFSKMKEVKPAYLKKLKKQITIKLDGAVIDYFKSLSEKMDIPYQNLINFYLRDCVLSKVEPKVQWKKVS